MPRLCLLLLFLSKSLTLWSQDTRPFLQGLISDVESVQDCLCTSDSEGPTGVQPLTSTQTQSSILYINNNQLLNHFENGTSIDGGPGDTFSFSFGRIMGAMIGLTEIQNPNQQTDFNTFVQRFLRRIDTEVPADANQGIGINDFVLRPSFTGALAWNPDGNGNFSMDNVPVTLVAIVYRPDLVSATTGGEARLIYDLDNATGRIIVEYKLPTISSVSPIAGQVGSSISATEWAALFGKLHCLQNAGQSPAEQQIYLNHLRDIFTLVAINRYDQEHFGCGSALGQLRVNEFTAPQGQANQWHLFEFQMEGCELKRHRMELTPLDHRYEIAGEGIRTESPPAIFQPQLTNPDQINTDPFVNALELARDGGEFQPPQLAYQNTHFSANNSWMKTLVGEHALFPGNPNTLYKEHLFGSQPITPEWQETARNISINTCVSCHSRGPNNAGPTEGAGGVFFFHSAIFLSDNNPGAFLTTDNGTGVGDFVQRNDRLLDFLGVSGSASSPRSQGICNPNIVCNFDYNTNGSSLNNIDSADLSHFQLVLDPNNDINQLPGLTYDLNGDDNVNQQDLDLLTQFVNEEISAGEAFTNPSCDLILPDFDDADNGSGPDDPTDPTDMTPCQKMQAFGDVAGDWPGSDTNDPINGQPHLAQPGSNGQIDHGDPGVMAQIIGSMTSGATPVDLNFDFNNDGLVNAADIQQFWQFVNGHFDCDGEEPIDDDDGPGDGGPTGMNACEKMSSFGDIAGNWNGMDTIIGATRKANLAQPGSNGQTDLGDHFVLTTMLTSGQFTNDPNFDFDGNGTFDLNDTHIFAAFVLGVYDCDLQGPEPSVMDNCQKLQAFGDLAGDDGLGQNGIIDHNDNNVFANLFFSGFHSANPFFDLDGSGSFDQPDVMMFSNFVNGNLDCGSISLLIGQGFHATNGSTQVCLDSIKGETSRKSSGKECSNPLQDFQKQMVDFIREQRKIEQSKDTEDQRLESKQTRGKQ
jgi:hypothetical protein